MLVRRPEHLSAIMTVLRILALSAACATLISCDSTKSGGGSSDPYASNYGNDGHYNPYPGNQPGYTNPTPSTPSYQTPPMPSEPPPVDPYSFSAPKTTTPTYSTPKKTASSSPAKKKSTTSSSKSTAAKKKSSSGSRYTVGKGDTLYGIARKKGTTVAKIKAANGMRSDLIRPGQSLKIP